MANLQKIYTQLLICDFIVKYNLNNKFKKWNATKKLHKLF